MPNRRTPATALCRSSSSLVAARPRLRPCSARGPASRDRRRPRRAALDLARQGRAVEPRVAEEPRARGVGRRSARRRRRLARPRRQPRSGARAPAGVRGQGRSDLPRPAVRHGRRLHLHGARRRGRARRLPRSPRRAAGVPRGDARAPPRRARAPLAARHALPALRLARLALAPLFARTRSSARPRSRTRSSGVTGAGPRRPARSRRCTT